MTSPTNTAGLEVVAWAWDHWTHLTDKWTRRATFDEPQDGSRVRNIEPLVTAASAQARIGELESRLEYLRSSRDGHAAQAHAEFVKRTMATDALISARAALHHHYVEWDGEPEDAVPLQEARSECDRVLAALQQEG